MIFEEVEPRADLRGHVLCSWRFALEDRDPERADHVIVPDGTLTIVADRRPGVAIFPMLMGPSMTAHVVTVAAGVAYSGLRLKAGAAMPLLGLRAGELRDRIDPLFLYSPDLAARIAEAGEKAPDRPLEELLMACVAPLAATAPPVDAVVELAVRRLIASHGGCPVARLAEGAQMSERQLRRRFTAAIGLLPKEFARIQRLRRAWTLAMEQAQANWSRISAETGYSDQAHLTREMARSFGTPPRFVEAYLRTIRHRLVDPVESMSENFNTGRAASG